MKVTLKEAAAILEELKAGKHIQGIDKHGRGVGHIYHNGFYIYWRYYGSSAIQATPEQLKWLLETIFDDCTAWDYCKYSEYHIGYIPENPKYTGIDYSMSHPNVYGL